MAQLSIFEKQKHYSKKDFTCSIGKYDMIYLTFRNNSWKRFTQSEKIAVYISSKGTLRFDDPVWGKGIVLKMKKGTGHPDIVEKTRYVQISGKTWPNILAVVRNIVGSYDFGEDAGYPYETLTTEQQADLRSMEIKSELNEFTAETMEKHGQKITETVPEQKTQLNLFMDAALALLQMSKSNEERVAIFNALAAVYSNHQSSAPEIPLALPKDAEEKLTAAIKNKIAEDAKEETDDVAARFEI